MVNPLTNPTWKFGTAARVVMAVQARGEAIMEKYVMRQVDGQHLIFKNLQGELISMSGDFESDGALYEPTIVDTDSVNTPESISAGEIHAKMEVVPAPTGEAVILDLVTSRPTGA
jgi:hypothetical protein